MKAPLPPDEEQRLAALREYDVLDTPPEQSFDDLTAVAANICQAPIALISLIDENRQWFKSNIGLSMAETSRDVAFCAHTILNPAEILEVRNLEADPRFADSTLVTSDPHVRFYAGAPLVTPDGRALGAICVMDIEPRTLTDEQLTGLRSLSRHVIARLELRRQTRDLEIESVHRRRAETLLRRQCDDLSTSKAEAEGLLELAQKSRRALLSVLEDEKRATQNLRESEERFRQLAENIDEVFWLTDPPMTQMFYVSPAYEKIWGRTCAALYARPQSWMEAIHPDDREAVHHAAITGLPVGAYDAEYRIIRPDGSIRWIHDRGFAVADAGGNIVRIAGVANDITQRKESEEELKLFRNLVDQSSDTFEVIDLETCRFVDVNAHGPAELGYTREEYLSKKVYEIDRGIDSTNLASFQEWMNISGVVRGEGRHWRKDGSSFPIEYTAKVVRLDRAYLVSTVRDITERKKAEARMREQAEMLDHAHEAIIVLDIHTEEITFWNRGAERLYGRTAAEAEGRGIGGLIFDDPSAPASVTAALLENGEWHGEHRHRSKAGKELIVSSHATLVRDAGGAPKSALVINIDVTNQKKLEEQFLRAQRMESIGTLASGVAHDLNNILAPILMAAPTLRDDLSPELRESIISAIEKSAERGADIVKQVLTFARGVESDRLTVQPVHLVNEMAQIARQTFPKSITVTARYSDPIWAVEGDPTQLHQVLLNLCVNARDAMPNGGELVMALGNFTVDEQYAAMMPESATGPYVILTVSDSGTGIPREIIEKIFDPFFTTKELGKGTGLGLSTVIGIVKSHGGFVTVESEPGRGTAFKIFLPATGGHAAAGPVTEEGPMPRGHGELILVVDDEENIVQITKTILEKHGYRAITAGDGTDALSLFAGQMKEIKVVLADVMMPVMDGVVLARVINRMSPKTHVIACSGQWDATREAKLRDAGVHVFLRKPYSAGKLLTALRNVLDPPYTGQK